MRRRDFIKAVAGSMAAWPRPMLAQAAMPVIGFLNGGSAKKYAPMVAAFRHGLENAGYIEGQNVAIEFRWGEGNYDRMATMAADLVQRQVTAIVATSTPAAQAAKAATSIIPIVFTTGADPVQLGLVASLNRPGGNVTGVSFLVNELTKKQIEVLHQMVPQVTSIGLLVNPAVVYAESQTTEARDAVRALGCRLFVVSAKTDVEIDAAFANLVKEGVGGVFTTSDPFLNSRRDQIIALAASYSLPALHPLRDYVVAGGLMSYGTSILEAYRQVGVYTGHILHGEKPADLPVVQPTRLELVINAKTAKALHLDVPARLLALADEVIE